MKDEHTKEPCPDCRGIGKIWSEMRVNEATNTVFVGGTVRNCKRCNKTGWVYLATESEGVELTKEGYLCGNG